MNLNILDWLTIVVYFALSIFIALKFRKAASKSLVDYFLGGRNLPWYIAGLSMVATTFAADTPLAVTELVANHGISGNWFWWNMLVGGMLTTFFFAKMWRKAEILTELEFIEIRYSGKSAAILRGFRAVYLGLFINVLIIGWVNIALMSLLKVFFGLSEEMTLLYTLIALIIVAIYSSISGIIGVAITDAFQFFIAMIGCIILSIIVVNSEAIGGIETLKTKLPANTLSFFPNISNDTSATSNLLTISLSTFIAYAFFQWWTSWYPGAEPGGGGYIAQRMMSTKNEKHSIYATLFFQIAHYAIRPWPWIIVALCALVLYPNLPASEKKLGYVMAMKDYLPSGLKGLLLVAFLSAYMSTVSTQLNWGASYLTNDLYKRFFLKKSNNATSEKKLVFYGRTFTILTMILSVIATFFINSISGVWFFLIECGAGLGLVLILRWYWWRINAWSEITATITPVITYAISKFIFKIDFPYSFFITVAVTTFAWLLVTYFTKPVEKEKLEVFYDKVKPKGLWKKANLKNYNPHANSELPKMLFHWLSSTILAYSLLFMIGKIILAEWTDALICTILAILSLLTLYKTFD